MTRRGPRPDDSILYEPDAIMVGLLLFPPHVCGGPCGMALPRCRDYFTPDAHTHAADGMRRTCRRCRREQHRDGERVRSQQRRDLAKVTP